MSEEAAAFILNLFESFWFEYGVFTSKPDFSSPNPAPVFEEKPKLSRITTLMRKSHSDQFLSSKDGCPSDAESPSPNSVLGPHLQTILSGKEVDDCPPKLEEKPEFGEKRAQRERRKVRRKSTGSRSYSELEFEELKGFMDLGFVFSDEDKDSKLASIIPGLQRFGKQSDRSWVSRPYLSEAWDSLEELERMKELRIPASFGNEMELKDHLRCWAHNVASAVR